MSFKFTVLSSTGEKVSCSGVEKGENLTHTQIMMTLKLTQLWLCIVLNKYIHYKY